MIHTIEESPRKRAGRKITIEYFTIQWTIVLFHKKVLNETAKYIYVTMQKYSYLFAFINFWTNRESSAAHVSFGFSVDQIWLSIKKFCYITVIFNDANFTY